MNSSKLLRCTNLSQLIYKNGQAGINKATVTLIFDNTDKQTCPIGYENEDELQVSRTIFTNNTTKFTLNGHAIKLKSLHQLFASVNLNIQTASFLIQQGKIAGILSASPKDILAQLEETAGTKMLEEAVDSAQKELSRKDIRLKSIKDKINSEILPKLEELEKSRKIRVEINKIQKGIRGIDMIASIVNIINTTSLIVQQTDKSTIYQNKINNVIQIVQNFQKQIKEKQDEIKGLQQLNLDQQLIDTFDNLNMQVVQSNQKSQQLNQNMQTIQNEKENLQKLIQKYQSENEIKIQNLQQSQNVQIVQTYQNLINQQNNLAQQIDLIENNQINQQILDNLPLTPQVKNLIIKQCFNENNTTADILTSLQEIKSKLQVSITINNNKCSSLQQTVKQFQIQQLEADQEDKELNRTFQLVNQQINYQVQELSQKLQIQAIDTQNMQQVKQYQIQCKDQINKLKNTFNQLKYQYEQGPKEFNAKKNRLFTQFTSQCYNKNNVAIVQMIKQIPKQQAQNYTIIGCVIDQIYLSDNFNAISHKYQVDTKTLLGCIEKIAGNRLFNVITSDISASQAFLSSQYCTKRCTILALNNMQFQQIDPARQNIARQNNGIILTDLISCNNIYSDLVNSLFGNLVICQNIEQAKQIAYNKQCYMKCITYQGDIVDPTGIVTGGSKLNAQTYLDIYMQYKDLNYTGINKQQLEQEQNKLEQLQNLYNNLSQQIQQYQFLQQKLQLSQGFQLQNDIKQANLQIEQLQQTLQEQQQTFEQYELVFQQIQQFIQQNNLQEADNLQLQLEQITQQINKIKQMKDFINAQRFIEQKQQIELEIKAREQDIQDIQQQIQQKQEQINELQAQIQEQNQSQQITLQRFTQTQSQVNQIKEQKMQADKTEKQLLQQIQQHQDQLNMQEKVLKQLQQEFSKIDEDQASIQQQLQQQLQQHSELISLVQIFNNDVYEYLLNNMKIKANQQVQFDTLIQLLQNIQENYIQINYQQKPEIIVKQISKYISNLDGIKSSLTKDIETLSSQQPASISITANLEELQQSSNKLIQMEQKIQEDKLKIQQLIEDVQQRKLEALENLYQQVNQSLSQIYQSLIPSATAQLEKVKKDDITAGIYLKTNMSGMSGGQKSLLALSFTLALLKSRPSPLYILDEIDAALDLSMTDNIGAMISKQFAGSQFLVISLKEGLFTKANKIFRVQYKDGSSRVEIVK